MHFWPEAVLPFRQSVVTLCSTKCTIIWAKAIIIKPTTAYTIVLLADFVASALPALVTYRKPPMIIISTAIAPAKTEIILITFLIVSLMVVDEPPGLQDVAPAAEQAPHWIWSFGDCGEAQFRANDGIAMLKEDIRMVNARTSFSFRFFISSLYRINLSVTKAIIVQEKATITKPITA